MQSERAFLSWKHSNGHYPCALATFGCQKPQVQTTKLVYVNPPHAGERIVNDREVQGGIALVIRGGCSFIVKARQVQASGAVAMILANNDRENIFETFSMSSKQPETEEEVDITIPCVTMSLSGVRELFKHFPPTQKTGMLTLQILGNSKEMLHCQSVEKFEFTNVEMGPTEVLGSVTCTLEPEREPGRICLSPKVNIGPVFTFVQWATQAEMYQLFYAPLADFCTMREGQCLEGKLIVADPIFADSDVFANESAIKDAIVLAKRGKCTFPEKSERLQRCGAIAVIIGNDDEEDRDAAFMMTVDNIPVNHLHIPLVMVSFHVFELLLQQKPHEIRIVCLNGESTAAILDSKQENFSLLKIPQPINSKDCVYRAARDGDVEKCRKLVSRHSGGIHDLITGRDVHHMTALHHACIGGHDQVVKFLLTAGARVDAMDLCKHLPVHLASLSGSMECLELLIQAQNDSDPYSCQSLLCRQNIGGTTPLHYASALGNTQCVELLLAAGAASVFNAEDSNRESGSTIQSNHRVNIQDQNGRTPLHIACISADLASAARLITANTHLDLCDHQNSTALEIVCSLADDPAKESSALQIAQCLIKSGAKVQKNGGNRLVLDVIRSKPLKQELEITYLCREVSERNCQLENLQREMATMCKLRSSLEQNIQQASQRVEQKFILQENVLIRQQSQIDILTQHFVNHEPSASIRSNPCRDNFSRSLEQWSDQELAQEAALERDLGKKHARENRSACAVECFQKSLLYFPLPGVRELLKAAENACAEGKDESRYQI
uniref:Uncharacterized protein AlNc14C393G11295 n=1 Tax=Albugo laibachii Nc14 TaxID=890382 RepID=F0WYN2_9STRA|nr:conserved hypothetical protein [Albugo laibachii Nc14]|eukprot:CCA26591.1 conserved hypothetical protein [Albugo laibachii Nc14]